MENDTDEIRIFGKHNDCPYATARRAMDRAISELLCRAESNPDVRRMVEFLEEATDIPPDKAGFAMQVDTWYGSVHVDWTADYNKHVFNNMHVLVEAVNQAGINDLRSLWRGDVGLIGAMVDEAMERDKRLEQEWLATHAQPDQVEPAVYQRATELLFYAKQGETPGGFNGDDIAGRWYVGDKREGFFRPWGKGFPNPTSALADAIKEHDRSEAWQAARRANPEPAPILEPDQRAIPW